MISLEESIRSYSLFQLEEVIKDDGTNYNKEAIEIATDEFTLRKIKSLSVIDQIDYIKSLDTTQKNYILHRSSSLYPPHIINIIRKENVLLGIEEPEWYYLDNSIPQGPFKFSDLKKIAEYNAIRPDTLVFRQADQNMVLAATIPGLFSSESFYPPPSLTFPQNQVPYQIIQQTNNDRFSESTSLGFGLSLVCFLVPIVGIVLYFTEKNEKGQNALALGLIGILVSTIFYMSFL